MLKIITALLVITTITSCKKDILVGNGTSRTELRQTAQFNRIQVDGKTDLVITSGTNFRVEATAYSNLLPQLETKVVDNTLIIGYKQGTSISNDNSVVKITMPALQKLVTTGASKIKIESGAANFFEAIVTGTSEIDAFAFTAKETRLTVEGSGKIELSVADKLHAVIIGSGNVYYKGNPVVTSSITGTGKVEQK